MIVSTLASVIAFLCVLSIGGLIVLAITVLFMLGGVAEQIDAYTEKEGPK